MAFGHDARGDDQVDRLAIAPHAPVHRHAGAIAHRGANALEHRLRVDDGLAVDALDAVARAQPGRCRRAAGAHLAHHRLAKRARQPDLAHRVGIDLARRQAIEIERHLALAAALCVGDLQLQRLVVQRVANHLPVQFVDRGKVTP